MSPTRFSPWLNKLNCDTSPTAENIQVRLVFRKKACKCAENLVDTAKLAKVDQVKCVKLKYSGYEWTGGKLVLVESLVENCCENYFSEQILVENVRWKIFMDIFWRKCHI